ncbi:MAG: beta-ketoacyl-ACP reductase [Acidobacteria bacterium]|nr:beta-ketoacyl-ACP reductase [Acidobacteriota bacterium]
MSDPGAGRVVLVTGGNRGIGAVIARRFDNAGYRVSITYRSNQPEDSSNIMAVRCDVTDTSQVDAAFSQIENELGPVEIVVANAGITADKLVLRMDEDDFASVLDTNLTGGFRVAKRAVRPMMKARFGRLIFISSVVGLAGQAGQANYAASKAGLIGLARSLAREFGSRGITANIVAPGPIATEMLDQLSEDQRAAIISMVPIGREGQPDEVAAAVCFIASDDAAFITGAIIPVDGGMSMG